MTTRYELVATDLNVDLNVDPDGTLYLIQATLAGQVSGHPQATQLLVLASDEGRAQDAVVGYLAAGLSKEEQQALLASHGKLVEFWHMRMLARPAKPLDLEQRLRDLAAGARSKADLLASKSPTSAYTNPVDVLRAVAKEAEMGLSAPPALDPAPDLEPAAMIHEGLMMVLRNDNVLRNAQTTWTGLSAGMLKVSLLSAELLRPLVAAYNATGRFFTDDFLDLQEPGDRTLTAHLLRHLNEVDHYTIGEEWRDEGFELKLFIDGEEDDCNPAVGLDQTILHWLQGQPELLEITHTTLSETPWGLRFTVGASTS